MLAETLATALLLGSLCARIPLHPLAKWVLRAKWVRWAGRVSYSFYLWHFVMLYIFAHLLFTYIPAAQIQAHTLWCSLGLAAVSITVTGVGNADVSPGRRRACSLASGELSRCGKFLVGASLSRHVSRWLHGRHRGVEIQCRPVIITSLNLSQSFVSE